MRTTTRTLTNTYFWIGVVVAVLFMHVYHTRTSLPGSARAGSE